MNFMVTLSKFFFFGRKKRHPLYKVKRQLNQPEQKIKCEVEHPCYMHYILQNLEGKWFRK